MSAILPASLVQHLASPLYLLALDPASLQRLLARLGVRAPITAADVAGLTWLDGILTATDAVGDAVEQLHRPDSGAEAVVALIDAVTAVASAIDAVRHTAPSGFFDASVLAAVADELPGVLLADALAAHRPVGAVLQALDLLAVERTAATSPAPWAQPVRRRVLKLDQLGDAVVDPIGRVRDRWGWSEGQVKGDRIVADLVAIAQSLGVRAHRCAIPDDAAGLVSGAHRWTRRAARLPLIDAKIEGGTRFVEGGLIVSPVESTGAHDEGVLVGVLADYPPPPVFPIGPDWLLEIDPPLPLGLIVRPGSVAVQLAPDGVAVAFTISKQETTTIDLPLATATIPGVVASIALAPDPASVELRLTTANGAPVHLDIDATSGSSFLSDLLGSVALGADVPLDISWSTTSGLRLAGTIGVSATISVGRQIGPVTVHDITVGLGASGGSASGARVSAALSASAALGPVVLTVDGLGVGLDIAPGADGSLVPDLGVVAIPPAGVGVGLQTDVASGGGYLFVDPDGTEYDGVLDIDLLGVGICAVALIDTDPPGVDGWSMFFALFIDVPSIPLGFGFTLNGVGGVVGINRTLDVEALQDAVRAGSLDAVLFPEDPIAEAPTIIDTFRSMFPSAAGRTVFGPVVSIGWGTPTLVEAELGIVISLPDPITIAVLGSISATLPTPDLALVDLHLDASGVIDLGAGTLAIDTSLHDSNIVGFALSGDMALRAGFGPNPSFLMALGGFHPRFDAPEGFPALDRLSLAVDAGSVLHVRFDSYLAVASNTVQFGAALSVTAGIDGFGIDGGVEFDALVAFAPFSIQTGLGFHVSISAVGVDLAGVWFDATVSGPNPWRFVGTATFKVLGIETSVHLDETIGRHQPEPVAEAVDVLALVRTALADDDAWSVMVTRPASDLLPLAAAVTADEVVAEPDGVIRLSQRAVPLDIDIERAGHAPVGDYDHFTLDAGTGLAITADVDDWFAPATFFEISPADALTAPSFELLAAGAELGGGDPIGGRTRTSTLTYEQIVRDPSLTEDEVAVDADFSPFTDGRAEMTTICRAARPRGYGVAAGDELDSLVPARTLATDRRSGEFVGSWSSWSAAHQSPAGRGSGAVLRPAWEVLS